MVINGLQWFALLVIDNSLQETHHSLNNDLYRATKYDGAMKGVDLRLCTGWYERLQEDMARGVRNDVSHQSRVQYPGQSELNVMLTAK